MRLPRTAPDSAGSFHSPKVLTPVIPGRRDLPKPMIQQNRARADACAVLTFFGLRNRFRHGESCRFKALALQTRSGRRGHTDAQTRKSRKPLGSGTSLSVPCSRADRSDSAERQRTGTAPPDSTLSATKDARSKHPRTPPRAFSPRPLPPRITPVGCSKADRAVVLTHICRHAAQQSRVSSRVQRTRRGRDLSPPRSLSDSPRSHGRT